MWRPTMKKDEKREREGGDVVGRVGFCLFCRIVELLIC
jgi:hypothetical protein